MPAMISEVALRPTGGAKETDVVVNEALLQGYRDMAADTERESEAFEWSEAMIGDGVATR